MLCLSMEAILQSNQRVLIREDLNVPMCEGKITSDERIQKAIPTIAAALKANARVLIMSHLGRPQEGVPEASFSLAPVARALSVALHQDIPLVKNWLEGVDVAPGKAVLLENVRFLPGENANDPILSKKIAALCDVFVMDAFATAHRAQASTVGVATYAKMACAGPLFLAEIDALSHALKNPARPLTAVVGGSKVSTKIHILDALLDRVDQLIVGGGIANTFLKAQGYAIGQSLCEPDWLKTAAQFFEKAARKNVAIPLPTDVIVAQTLSKDAQAIEKSIAEIAPHESIFDIGPKTAAHYGKLMQQAKTIVWNGPLGVFEIDAFSHGTRLLAEAISKSRAYSLVGGGDTLAAIDKFGGPFKFSYISTAGGAFLEFLEGKTLPALAILQKRANHE